MKYYIWTILFSVAIYILCSTEDNTPVYTLTTTASPAEAGEITPDWPRDTTTEVVDVYNPVTGRTWMDRNLGASRMAQSSNDEEAYGDLYQWGRAADGHEKRNSRIYHADYRYIDNSNTNTPGHGYFITGFITDWRNPRNDTLWQGSKGINNPCPEDYRLPTKIEWEEEILSWKSKDAAGAFASPLKLPTAGFRDNREDSRGLIVLTGPLYGAFGGYWSSTIYSIYPYKLFFDSPWAGMITDNRAHGYTVRCIKD